MPTPPSQPLADALKRDAPRFNARYQRAAAAMLRLDPEVFAAFLRGNVAPVVDAVAAEQPDRVPSVVEGLFRVALQMVGHELSLRYPGLDRLWSLFAALPGPVAFDAGTVAAMAVNVYCNVADTPGARTDQFLDELERLAPAITMARELRQVLLVLAWRAGYSQARDAALLAFRHMETPRAISLTRPLQDTTGQLYTTSSADTHWRANYTGLPAECGQVLFGKPLLASEIKGIGIQLQGDPWLRPEDCAADMPRARSLRIAGRAGGFRGFGGPFLAPPTVALHDGRFVLTDGASWWALAADIFGTTLRRLDHAPSTPAQPNSQQWALAQDGLLKRDGQEIRMDVLADPTSWAADDTTLVVTTNFSHHAYVIAAV